LRIKNLPLATAIAIMASLVIAVVFSALIGFLSWSSNRTAVRQVHEHLSQQMSAIAIALEDNFLAAQQSAKLRLNMYKNMLPAQNFSLSQESITTEGSLAGVPVIKVGDLALNNNMAFLEKVKTMLEADPAVMVLHNGKFVRVATFLKKDGKSQIGVPLANDSREAQTLLKGETFYGMVNRSGVYYMSIFEPVYDSKKTLIGAISVRVGVDDIMARLRQSISGIKVAQTGYAYVMQPGKTVEDTIMLVHPSLAGKRVGDLNNTQLTETVGALINVRNGVLHYPWTDSKTGVSGDKIAAVAEVKHAGWIVGSGSWEAEFTAEARSLRNGLILAAALCGVLTVALIAWAIRRGLAPVQLLVESVREMGAGNLSRNLADVPANSHNEVDRLQGSLSRMQQDMAGVIRRITQSAQALGQVAGQLDQGSDRVLTSSGHQADAASTLSSAVEEMASSIGHVSDNASRAEQLAQHTADAAQAGSRKVSEVASEMHQVEAEIMSAAQVVHALGQRTSEISQVIQIIKEVADQTNLLALNAAIEAARAGEQGRGFAVVADEVRKLAERTTQSTLEISQSIGSVQQESGEVVRRIEQVVERIGSGVQAVEDAGRVLGEIESQSKQAVDAVAGIASSMREQSGASQSIADGVETIANMSEANSQSCRDNREHTQQLGQLARELDSMVSGFRV